MRRTALPLLITAVLFLVPDAASAQLGAAPARPSGAASATAAGPPLANRGLSPAAVPRALRAPVASPATAVAEEGRGSVRAVLQEREQGGIPFMVAGGALFVAGAVVGGDAGTLLMVGGAGVGAYGLYVYFGGS